jgi:hypothetical protein
MTESIGLDACWDEPDYGRCGTLARMGRPVATTEKGVADEI